MNKIIEMTFSLKLSEEWVERTVPLVYVQNEVLNINDIPRPISFQKYERSWIFSPRASVLQENIGEIGIVIIPSWVINPIKKGFEWRGFIPYHVHDASHNHSFGSTMTLEQAMYDSENWIMNCMGIK